VNFCSQEFVDYGSGSTPSLPPMTMRSAEPARTGSGFTSAPSWLGTRSFEVGETDRLNEAHWQLAKDTDINCWLGEKLAVIRGRATYETRNNALMAGIVATAEDDIIGEDGPILSVHSEDEAYSEAAEEAWRQWFVAPTFRPNVSGTALLKLWVRNLLRCGEFLSTIGTDENAEGPVAMRLRPLHPRRLATPHSLAGDQRCIMGVQLDRYDRPIRYWIGESEQYNAVTNYEPYPPDMVIHEFRLDEEGQARGYPWLTPSLQPGADLRDFDDQVQDASRQMADQSAMLWTNHPDAPVWTAPESATVERRTYKMAPPGWQPWKYDAGAPPVQYPDYRSERHLDLGRPINMPGLIVRLDGKRHNYSSARFDSQGWARTCTAVQCFLSGTPESYGTLNRLLDMVVAEARFSVPQLRRRPKEVTYEWTFPPRKHVDPAKEADGEAIGLETQMLDPISGLNARGTTLKRHVLAMKRFVAAYKAAGLDLPLWLTGPPQASAPTGRDQRQQQSAAEEKQTEDKQQEAVSAK